MDAIPKSVIIETRDILSSYFERATENDIVLFRQNPIQTLKSLGISLVNRISSRRLTGLINYVRTIIDKVGNAFREWRNCAACKIALKLVFFAFASIVNIPITEIINHTDFIKLLSEFFEKSLKIIIEYLGNLGITVGEYNFFEIDNLIERLCGKFGYCE